VWVDVRPDESTGVLLNLAVGNGGPTLATNVRVAIDPPLPTIDQLRERVEAAQARLAAGISYLPPGRTLTWPLGQGFNLLKDSGSQAHTFTVKVDGPFGPVPTLTYTVDLADLRGLLDRPAGSLHQLTKAVEDLPERWPVGPNANGEDWLVAFGGGMEAGARSPHPARLCSFTPPPRAHPGWSRPARDAADKDHERRCRSSAGGCRPG
jgi:hypothetical protein